MLHVLYSAAAILFYIRKEEEDTGKRHPSDSVLLLQKITSFLRCDNISVVWKYTGKIKIEFVRGLLSFIVRLS